MKLQIEISPEELKQIKDIFEAKFISDIAPDIKPIVTGKKVKLFYDNSMFDEIKIDDTIQVLPSENCVTNTDTIKYDEIISDEPGVVVSINAAENKVTILCMAKKIDVHPSWIKRLKK